MRPKAPLALVKLRSTNQAHVNRTFYADGADMAEAAIRDLVRVEQEGNPYFGRHDWLLGEVTGLVEWRNTIYAKPGDIVLLTQDLAGVVSFYSIREACMCVAGSGIKPSRGWDEAFAYWRAQAGKDPATWIVAEPDEGEGDPVMPEPWLPPALEDDSEPEEEE
jgi:hypothetical protein